MSTPDQDGDHDHEHFGTVTGLVGPIVIGTILNVWLFGVVFVQTQTYARNPSRDPPWIKMTVAFLFLCSTVSTVFDCVSAYTYSVQEFGHWRHIQTATWVLNADPTMTVLITSTVQGFFAWRIRRLTGKTWLAVLIGACAFAQFLCGLGTSIGYGMVKKIIDFQRVKAIIIAWLVLAPITDTVISVVLVLYLKRHRTGFAFTDDIVSKITRLTIQTGAITALWSTLDLAIFLAYPNNLYLILNMPLSPLYVNCFMSFLNARQEWNERPDTQSGKADIRGITVTRTVGVHRDSYELNHSVNSLHTINKGNQTHGDEEDANSTRRTSIGDTHDVLSFDDEEGMTIKTVELVQEDTEHLDREQKVDVEWVGHD